MTVAFDAFTANANQTADHNFNHTPVGTPRAVIVWVVERAATADHIAGITYGGDAMTEVSGSPAIISTGETGVVYCYFLGTSIPTGVQSVSVDTTATSNYITYCVTLTAANDCTVQDSDGTIASVQANPSITLSLGGKTSWAGLALHSGQQAVTGITQLTNWTARSETDRGTDQAACYTYDTISTADVTAGWTQTSEEALAVCIAVTDVTSQLFSRTINENAITTVDTSTKVAIKPRTITENAITVSETVTKIANKFRAISESILATDSTSKSALKPRIINENAITTIDTSTRFRVFPRVINEAAITVSDSATKVANKFRSISESILTTDSTTKSALKPRTISESILTTDSTNKLRTVIRSVSESITTSDTANRLRTVIRAISESVTTTDTTSKSALKSRTINENPITTVDTSTRYRVLSRIINEAITVSDSVTKAATKIRSVFESITTIDSTTKTASFFRTVSETITTIDQSIRTFIPGGGGGQLFVRVINESITVSDSIGSLFTKFIHAIGGRPPGGNIFRRRYEKARKKWSPDWRKMLNKRIGIE